MLTCTFFGHKDAPNEIESLLLSTLIDLIENKNILKCYVGNHGNFDFLVARCLSSLKRNYPIDYCIVLAYMPLNSISTPTCEHSETLLPKGIEKIPKRFAISFRNKWMIERSEYVITYVEHTFGCSVRFQEMAKKKKKTVINLADLTRTDIEH